MRLLALPDRRRFIPVLGLILKQFSGQEIKSDKTERGDGDPKPQTPAELGQVWRYTMGTPGRTPLEDEAGGGVREFTRERWVGPLTPGA